DRGAGRLRELHVVQCARHNGARGARIAGRVRRLRRVCVRGGRAVERARLRAGARLRTASHPGPHRRRNARAGRGGHFGGAGAAGARLHRRSFMIKPYTAVGLIPTVRGIRKRKDIMTNLEHLSHLVKAASWLSSLDLPVRLIAFPEGALQGFNDEVLDLDHVQFAREGAIDIPGEETEFLGKIAGEYDAFLMAQAKARHPDLKDRFFNVGFILNPKGEVILQHYKVSPLFPVEHSVCPHDVYDWWVEKYGRTLQAFWPVVDTEIGRM